MRRLLTALSRPVYRFGRGFCRNAHDAEDVMQDVLTALARSLDRFRGDSSLTTWAYTVARNACLRHRRREIDPARLEPLGAESGPAALLVTDPRSDPMRAVEQGELRDALAAAIQSLPPAQREVLILRDVEGLSAREVGSVLRLGERAVKSRLHRARMELRGLLSGHLEDGAPARRRRGDAAGDAGPRDDPGRAPRARRCPDTALLLSRHIEGDLDARLCETLEAHVAGCPSCRDACRSLRAALRVCRRGPAASLTPVEKEMLRRAVRSATQVIAP